MHSTPTVNKQIQSRSKTALRYAAPEVSNSVARAEWLVVLPGKRFVLVLNHSVFFLSGGEVKARLDSGTSCAVFCSSDKKENTNIQEKNGIFSLLGQQAVLWSMI